MFEVIGITKENGKIASQYPLLRTSVLEDAKIAGNRFAGMDNEKSFMIVSAKDKTAVYYDSGFDYRHTLSEKSKEPSVYFDMDGTLCYWHRDGKGLAYPEEILDPINHYYRDLAPHTYTVELARRLVQTGIDVCIISASDIGAVKDKMVWLDRWCPFIKKENIFFCPIGADKTQYVKGNVSKSILIDDYNKNLYEWEDAGGCPVKLVNTINSANMDFPNLVVRAFENESNSKPRWNIIEKDSAFIEKTLLDIKNKMKEKNKKSNEEFNRQI